MKKTCTFINNLGYSCILRIGKLYNIPNDHYVYLMENNEDLVDISHIIRQFLHKCREIIMEHNIARMLNPKDLLSRELGLVNANALKYKYFKARYPKSIV